MKGVSLAIETIIVIILAVTTLTILLLFFLGTGGQSQDRVMLETVKVDLCGKLVLEDPTCGNTKNFGEREKLIETCDKIAPICQKDGTTDEVCIQTCCNFVCRQ